MPHVVGYATSQTFTIYNQNEDVECGMTECGQCVSMCGKIALYKRNIAHMWFSTQWISATINILNIVKIS